MRKIVGLCFLLLFYLQGFSQFPIHAVMPSMVTGVTCGDTLLNTSTVLKREGIKKVLMAETSINKGVDRHDKTEYSVVDGKISIWVHCFRRSIDTGFKFCIRDTLLYDNNGRLREFKAVDGSDTPYMRCNFSYPSDGTVIQTWITKDPQTSIIDTSISRSFYNNLGQLIRCENVKARYPMQNASLYYHEDGLLDSIRHDDSGLGTFVFKRKNKRGNKHITLETRTTLYEWVYNSQRQCISYSWAFKKTAPGNNPLFSKSVFTYNGDGTLANVLEKGRDLVNTIVYSYLR